MGHWRWLFAAIGLFFLLEPAFVVLGLGSDFFAVSGVGGFLLRSVPFFAGTDECFAGIDNFVVLGLSGDCLLLPAPVNFAAIGAFFAGTDECFCWNLFFAATDREIVTDGDGERRRQGGARLRRGKRARAAG